MVDSVDIQPNVIESPEGHDERMAALIDARQSGQPDPAKPEAVAKTGDRPEWLPEKFSSVEDMAKAYKELESKLGQPKPAEATATAVTTEQAESTTVEDAAKVAQAAGIDYNGLYDEYVNGGQLSEESYNKLAQSGIPKDIVDAYIAGQEAQAEVQRTQLLADVGGESAYGEMVKWAQGNMSKPEVEAYDRVVSGNDLEMIKIAISGLHAKYMSANPASPRLLSGSQNVMADAFQSWSQVTAAMKDPRYTKDPAYQAAVQEKIGRSQL
jgi:hypothetical protein